MLGGMSEWRQRLHDSILQESLILTHPSRTGVRQLERRPEAVFVGIGLCSRSALSVGTPLDVLGLLLPAALIRRAVGADKLVVLIADTHAMSNGFASGVVADVAARTRRTLTAVGRGLGIDGLELVMASEMTRSPGYADILADVEARSQPGRCTYVKRQVADVGYMQWRYGSIIKVGWALGRQPGGVAFADEREFDREAQAQLGAGLGFVYCRPGRTFDMRCPKAPPYVATRLQARICLEQQYEPAYSIESARMAGRPEVVNGCINHLKSVASAYSKHWTRLHGRIEHRLNALWWQVRSAAEHARIESVALARPPRRGDAHAGAVALSA